MSGSRPSRRLYGQRAKPAPSEDAKRETKNRDRGFGACAERAIPSDFFLLRRFGGVNLLAFLSRKVCRSRRFLPLSPRGDLPRQRLIFRRVPVVAVFGHQQVFIRYLVRLPCSLGAVFLGR